MSEQGHTPIYYNIPPLVDEQWRDLAALVPLGRSALPLMRRDVRDALVLYNRRRKAKRLANGKKVHKDQFEKIGSAARKLKALLENEPLSDVLWDEPPLEFLGKRIRSVPLDGFLAELARLDQAANEVDRLAPEYWSEDYDDTRTPEHQLTLDLAAVWQRHMGVPTKTRGGSFTVFAEAVHMCAAGADAAIGDEAIIKHLGVRAV